MKRLLCLSLLSVLLAACTTPSQIPPETAPGGVPPAAEGPLVVPPLSALSDTPPRALAAVPAQLQRPDAADQR
ncbi:membrane-bound transglycosylase [Bordetella pertussis]|nr:membrane-bound transglycosylase [Bordetella pertussis]